MKRAGPLFLLLLTASSALAQLNPDTFEMKMTLLPQSGPPGHFLFSLQYHHGPTDSNATWVTVTELPDTDVDADGVQCSLGTLTHSGLTFRVAILSESGGAPIYSVNEIYVPYPFLSNATVNVQEPSPGSNTVTIAYNQDIYSNSVTAVVPPATTAAFFRMWSPDNDPTNAIIQMCTNSLEGAWTECTKQ